MTGPDLPPPTGPIECEVYAYRWPSGAEKVELIDGALLFYGEFDERMSRSPSAPIPVGGCCSGRTEFFVVYPGGSDWTIWSRYGGEEA